MDGSQLLDIAATWSHWEGEPPPTVPRRLALPDELSPSVCLVVQGVRRCGKTTLLQQLPARYGLARERCLFVNLEDPRLSGALHWRTLDALVGAWQERHPEGAELAFFLDEIQVVEGWQRWLRAQLDRPRPHRFAITGSNSQLLSGELSTSLTGRHLTVELFPFDLAELRLARRGATLEDWLHLGGFPEPLQRTPADGDLLRRQYFVDIVERDVRERIGARSSRPLRQVAQVILESAGSELSLRRLAAATGVSVDTAGSYVDACEAAYLLFSCPWFAWSERRRAHRNRKFYPVDTGLRRVVRTPGGADRGKALECATFLALRRRHDRVSYWRGKGEVDFVVEVHGEPVPVQVSWEGAQERHHRALDEFYETFPRAREAVFVTASTFEEALAPLVEAG